LSACWISTRYDSIDFEMKFYLETRVSIIQRVQQRKRLKFYKTMNQDNAVVFAHTFSLFVVLRQFRRFVTTHGFINLRFSIFAYRWAAYLCRPHYRVLLVPLPCCWHDLKHHPCVSPVNLSPSVRRPNAPRASLCQSAAKSRIISRSRCGRAGAR
jgi:hypothetical protein